MSLSGKDHDRQAADPSPSDGQSPATPAEAGRQRRKARVEAALATAQNMANSAEHVLLLYAAVSATETDTALAAVKAARAVLYLAQIVLRSLQKKQH